MSETPEEVEGLAGTVKALAECSRIRDERDELRTVLASTTDALNVLLRENGLAEVQDPYRSFQVRVGIHELHDKLAERHARAIAEIARLQGIIAAVPTSRLHGIVAQSCSSDFVAVFSPSLTAIAAEQQRIRAERGEGAHFGESIADGFRTVREREDKA